MFSHHLSIADFRSPENARNNLMKKFLKNYFIYTTRSTRSCNTIVPTSARGVLVNCASSRRVRPRLRNHRMDIANRPHTYRLRWCGDEEWGG